MSSRILPNVAALFFALILSMGTAAAQSEKQDGNWWVGQEKSAKISYVNGFFEGIELGKNLSFWKWVHEPNKAQSRDDARQSFSEYSHQYLNNVTNSQLADGLDTFYQDNSNRNLRISTAAWLVLNQIAGNPNIKAMIANFKRNE